mmetsp:Transcript_27896/g.86877  ORF Transcript_27896/g.86877 Transcript_27896/m.86877 type:complete len:222 (-) Transcript_27896:50-715(-)
MVATGAPGNVDLQAAGRPQTSQEADQASPQGGGGDPAATQEAVVEAGREVVRSAVSAVRQGGGEIHMYIVSNPYSVTVLSFIGGLALLAASAVSLLNLHQVLTDPLEYILNVYVLFFGLAIVAIDGPGDRLPRLREKVLTHASFLHNNTNRTLFYGFLACQQVSNGSTEKEVWRQVVGCYFLFVALAHGAIQCNAGRQIPADHADASAAGQAAAERPASAV